MITCPKGHESSEGDFCSECGAKIGGAPPAPVAPTPVAPGPAKAGCPDCEAPRDGGDFCEVCGYNFVTRAHGELPPAKEPVTPPPAVKTWRLTVNVDASLWQDGSPAAPTDFTPFEVALKPGSSLIGRTSPKRGVHPEVALDRDDAISHRHALLDYRADGSLWLRDVGSSNGTRVNGKDAEALTDIELHDGDGLEAGHWTRIAVKAAI